MTSIKEMDQNSWVCYKFGDSSYYYGEVGQLDQSGVVQSKDNTQLATDPKVKLVKHGFGIYIYDDPTGENRYQGQWAKDQKSGKGILKLKDGSIYEGFFKDGFYHDNGILKWKNGDSYDGKWRKGRMEGPGVFKRNDGLVLKGSFKNNYFIDGTVLRNPFMSQHQYEDLKKRRKQIVKQQEKNEKVKNGYFERVLKTQINKISQPIQKSAKNNRVALIVGSQESGVTLQQIKSGIKQSGNEMYVIDLRKSYKLEGQQKYNYIKQVSHTTQQCLKNGGVLILSLDQSEAFPEFDQFFYPQVKQLYSSSGFNHTIWAPKDLKKSQIKDKLIGSSPLNDKFYFGVWSKLKLSEGLTNDQLRQKLQKRFESIIPYIKIDVIFVENGKKVESQPKAA